MQREEQACFKSSKKYFNFGLILSKNFFLSYGSDNLAFKNALCKLIVTENLPFYFVESVACLAVPSTSTPSERAFSRGRLILHYTRSCLSAEKIRALICLSSWYKEGFC